MPIAADMCTPETNNHNPDSGGNGHTEPKDS